MFVESRSAWRQPRRLKQNLTSNGRNPAGTQDPPTLTLGKSSRYLWLLEFCVLAYLAPSFAVLGGDISSVRADRAHLIAWLHLTQTQNYTIDELRSIPPLR